MKPFVLSLAWTFALVLASSLARAAVVEHTFNVEDVSIQRLCRSQVITAVNGTLPGPTINAREGDTVIVHVFNKSPYNLTLHWHGIIQYLTPWSDGPEFVTQCPIPSGGSYTYKFNLTGQEGTLWWHAHSSFLRATVYGALFIRPRLGHSYPFPKPYQEIPLLLGEWWNANVVEVEHNATESQLPPIESDAYTINGLPSDLYNCSQDGTYEVKVKQGKTYMLRIINAALNAQHFFKIANHTLTVVAVDALYTHPYKTDVVVIAPGQTLDVLITTKKPAGSYYMVFNPYHSAPGVGINGNMTRGVITYKAAATSPSKPIMPDLPQQIDTPTAHKFYTNITGLAGGPHWVPVPRHVDEHMFITFGLSFTTCNNFSGGCTDGQRPLSANMNNESFVLPRGKGASMLEAFYLNNVSNVYTRDFPNRPPVVFDYTNPNITRDTSFAFQMAPKSTKVKVLKFNQTVEIVLQNTAIIAAENHPMHIHGYNFHVLAQGFGNYNATRDEPNFNLVNPQIRNTIAVPVGGWAVVRFQANNPGVWLVHCHLETHLPWGLAMAFEVENGPTPSLSVPPPPSNLPKC